MKIKKRNKNIKLLEKRNVLKIKDKTLKEAELVGIILGDGHLSNNRNYDVVITCGMIDYKYIHKFIPNLIEELFLKKPTIYYLKFGGIAVQARLHSKYANLYLSKKYNLQRGRKKNIEIPEKFFKNRHLLKACIRGMIDTDGGIYRHHERSIQIVFNNNDFTLIKSFHKALSSLGYRPKMSMEKRKQCKSYLRRKKYKVYLFTEDSKRYAKEIGFSNPKNIIKYNYWLKNGKIPNHDKIVNAVAGI